VIVFPALDLLGGRGVRLERGAFDAVTVYESDPLAAARRFAAAGASWLHVVDLDGARLGAPAQAALIGRIARESGLKVQAGGGIRDLQAARALLGEGVGRIVLGSLAVREPELALMMLRELGPEQVVLAADLLWRGRAGAKFLAEGWQTEVDAEAFDVIASFAAAGLRYLLSTDVTRDGMLTGASLDLYRELRGRFPELSLIASGGVASLTELPALRALGVHGVVVGKALYEGRFTLESALSC
jgi:phosphoribosylformimino-5-aminoimidazole carboxamide ribotide isomerase